MSAGRAAKLGRRAGRQEKKRAYNERQNVERAVRIAETAIRLRAEGPDIDTPEPTPAALAAHASGRLRTLIRESFAQTRGRFKSPGRGGS